MKIEITNKLTLHAPPRSLQVDVIDRLTFTNPKWLENERHGYWNGDTPRLLKFYEQNGAGSPVIPRGFARQLLGLCKRYGVKYQLVDKRRTLPEVDIDFQGALRPFQVEAVEAMAARDFGCLSAPTGSGKTVMALWIISHQKQPPLIITHTKELQNQWISRIETFLGIPGDEVGRIGGGKRTIGEKITVALVQSLYKCSDEVAPHIGHLIVDECHRTPSRTFTEAVTAFDCRYMLGLSATPYRRDDLSRLIYWHLGDVVHEINKGDLIETGDVLPAEVVVKETDFKPLSDPSTEYSTMLSELTVDYQRNALIVSDVAQEAKNGSGICLVLSDRKAHCETLQSLLREQGISAELLTGDLSNRHRERVVKDLNEARVKVLISTTQLLSEGFDAKALSMVFLTTPIKFSGRLIQCVGRALRPAPGKDRARVFDYLDVNVGVLRAAFKARSRVYSTTGGFEC